MKGWPPEHALLPLPPTISTAFKAANTGRPFASRPRCRPLRGGAGELGGGLPAVCRLVRPGAPPSGGGAQVGGDGSPCGRGRAGGDCCSTGTAGAERAAGDGSLRRQPHAGGRARRHPGLGWLGSGGGSAGGAAGCEDAPVRCQPTSGQRASWCAAARFALQVQDSEEPEPEGPEEGQD